ncbi:hypothetical protein CHCC14821_4210 [Bacillus paralicheniformis]|nr:hypothetical protein CHCC14821_4210 [Bacillus paralicheniformis]TWM61884.1 hypothetical protein CHCC14814_2727 [Bacillus paralicheniformis]
MTGTEQHLHDFFKQERSADYADLQTSLSVAMMAVNVISLTCIEDFQITQ